MDSPVDGRIESIYAGKKEISGQFESYLSSADYNAIAQSVAGWLEANDVYNVEELFENYNDAKLNEFVTYISDNHLYQTV